MAPTLQWGRQAIAVALTVVVILSSCVWWIAHRLPNDDVRVVYCDVGQGDGVLVTHQYTQALIDAGPDKKILDCLSQKMPFGDSHLEVVIATHPDQDHIGGFPAVFERYSVSHIFVIGITKTTNGFDAFRTGIMQKVQQGAHLHIPKAGQTLALTSLVGLDFLYPLEEVGNLAAFSPTVTREELQKQAAIDEKEHPSFNDLSISTRVRVGGFSHMLTGDLEEVGERQLLSSRVLSQVTVLKAGHHGSRTSTSRILLESVDPKYLVISSGASNKYGHPHAKILEDAQSLSIPILRTDQLGTLVWTSNGLTQHWE